MAAEGGELGKRGLMLRTRAPEVSLWEAVLPDEVLRLPEELVIRRDRAAPTDRHR